MKACAIAIWRRFPAAPGSVRATYIGQVTMKPPTRTPPRPAPSRRCSGRRPAHHDQGHREPLGQQHPEEQPIGAFVDLAEVARQQGVGRTIVRGRLQRCRRRRRRGRGQVTRRSRRRSQLAHPAEATTTSCGDDVSADASRAGIRARAAALCRAAPLRIVSSTQIAAAVGLDRRAAEDQAQPWLLRGSLNVQSSMRTYFSKMRVR